MGGVSVIHFHAASTTEGRAALAEMTKLYGQAAPEQAAFIVALGGDGTLLEALHRHHVHNKPFYGMNRGSVGFLLNPFRTEALAGRLAAAQNVKLTPLRMKVKTGDGSMQDAIAFNEISLLREERQAAKIGISINDVERLAELICDGILVATPAGSTAYNLSAHGPIIPLGANLLALTPISAFRPRRWRGALLPHSSAVHFTIRETEKRPVSATADFTEIRNVTDVKVAAATDISVTLLFDPDYDLEERVLKEQFAP